jgi:hypothetical protein
MSKKELAVNSAKKGINRRQFLTGATVGAGVLVMSASYKGFVNPVSAGSTTPWSFGVISDTQWADEADDGWDPNTSAIEIAKQIQQQLIAAGVAFVVHVGDLCDSTPDIPGEDARALYAQPLYNAGIGFYPVRGNHDDNAAVASEFVRIYPQTSGGLHNATPSDVLTMSIPSPDSTNLGIPSKSGSGFPVGTWISSPSPSYGNLTGLSYAFSYNNATFVLLDQFTPPGGWPTGYDMSKSIQAQQSWISSVLSSRAAGSHAFVFAHKGLITCNHSDVLFSTSGGSSADNPAWTNAFISSLYNNNVKLYVHGHDHMHDRSIVLDTNGNDYVTQLLCASDSSKFYLPKGTTNGAYTQGHGSNPYASNDDAYDVPAFGIRRRIPLSQEYDLQNQLNLGNLGNNPAANREVGYYIVTVNGANVTVDYYACAVACPWVPGDSECLLTNGTANLPGRNPSASFTKRETFGYGLNGKQFLIASGKSYKSVKDNFDVTSVSILSGTNGSTLTDANGIKLTKAVNTGWQMQNGTTLSDILTLWGMGSLANANPTLTDTYVLELTGDTSALGNIATGGAGLAALNPANGKWVNAVNLNNGGTPTFVPGPWTASCGLGSYGVSGTSAWAVINFQGTFAIAQAD